MLITGQSYDVFYENNTKIVKKEVYLRHYINVMIKKLRLIIVLAVAVMLGSCSSGSSKMRSGGAKYEIFVIGSQSVLDGELGDTLRSILLEPVFMINQREPIFDPAFIPPSAYKGIILQHRNILKINIDKAVTAPALLAQYDEYVQPQIIVSLNAPDLKSAVEYISENRKDLRTIFELAERDRAIELNKKYNEVALENEVRNKFGFEMSVPRGYKLRDSQQDFLWLSFEMPQSSQGIVIYSYPYEGKSDFTLEALTKRRDEFVSKIPGPTDGSYMITADVIDPELIHSRIGGRYWAQMNGFWDVYSDFMGGPFLSYSTVDTQSNRVICIDMYVYSPKDRKRNFLRSLEHLVYSVEFPSVEVESSSVENK